MIDQFVGDSRWNQRLNRTLQRGSDLGWFLMRNQAKAELGTGASRENGLGPFALIATR